MSIIKYHCLTLLYNCHLNIVCLLLFTLTVLHCSVPGSQQAKGVLHFCRPCNLRCSPGLHLVSGRPQFFQCHVTVAGMLVKYFMVAVFGAGVFGAKLPDDTPKIRKTVHFDVSKK